jgi:hypothetical protein
MTQNFRRKIAAAASIAAPCALSLALGACTFEVKNDDPAVPMPAPTQSTQGGTCRLGEGRLAEVATIETNLENAYALVGGSGAGDGFAVGTENAVGLFGFGPDGPELDAVVTGLETTAYVVGTGCALALAADGSRFVFGKMDGEVTVWDAASRTLLARLPASGNAVRALAISDDGSLVAVADTAGMVRLWNPESPEAFPAPQQFLANAISFVPGARDLLVAGSTFTGWSSLEQLQRWSHADGFVQAGQCGLQSIQAVAPTPDGARIVAVGGAAVTRFDSNQLESSAVSASADWHDPLALAMAADGMLFATVGREGTLRLWRTSTMAEISRVDVALQIGVVIDRAGEHIASVGRDGVVHVFGCAR